MVRTIRWTLTVLTGSFLAVIVAGAIAAAPQVLRLALPAFIAALGATGLWIEEHKRRQLMRRNGARCPSCGYDRRGLSPDAPCPECGRGACITCGYDRRGLPPNANCPECGTLPTPPPP